MEYDILRLWIIFNLRVLRMTKEWAMQLISSLKNAGLIKNAITGKARRTSIFRHGTAGKASRWNTLRALRVFSYFGINL